MLAGSATHCAGLRQTCTPTLHTGGIRVPGGVSAVAWQAVAFAEKPYRPARHNSFCFGAVVVDAYTGSPRCQLLLVCGGRVVHRSGCSGGGCPARPVHAVCLSCTIMSAFWGFGRFGGLSVSAVLFRLPDSQYMVAVLFGPGTVDAMTVVDGLSTAPALTLYRPARSTSC